MMHDVEKRFRRQPIRDPDRWELLNEMIDEHQRQKANADVFYRKLKWWGAVAAVLSPVVVFFHDWIVHISDAALRIFRGGN